MLIEDSGPQLRALGERLFALAEQLGGRGTGLSGDWYRFEIVGAPALYFRFIGGRARTYPKNSIHVATQWHNDFDSINGVTRGNNWYGASSADICVRPGYAPEIENAEAFVRRACGYARSGGSATGIPVQE